MDFLGGCLFSTEIFLSVGSIKIFGVVDREYSDKYLLKVRAGKVDCGIKQSNDTNIGKSLFCDIEIVAFRYENSCKEVDL